MNVVELWENMNVGQTASNPINIRKIYKSDNGLCWNDENGKFVDLNIYILEDDNWEPDDQWVDFWTAYQAAKEGYSISKEGSGHWSKLLNLSNTMIRTEDLDSRWKIKL